MSQAPSRVAVVTGGSRGIGRAFVVEAARRGFDVVFSHRGRGRDAQDTIEEAQGAGSSNVVGVQADVASPDGIEAIASAVHVAGQVHILINNAGVMAHGMLAETTQEGWDESFSVHVTAPLLLTRALLDSLRSSRGAVLNISSTGGVVGSLHGVSYGASKAAVIGLSKTMARELAPHIRVNTLAPGPVSTELYADLPESERRAVEEEMLLKRVGLPEEIARVGLDLCSWGYATGITVVADGGRVLQ